MRLILALLCLSLAACAQVRVTQSIPATRLAVKDAFAEMTIAKRGQIIADTDYTMSVSEGPLIWRANFAGDNPCLLDLSLYTREGYPVPNFGSGDKNMRECQSTVNAVAARATSKRP